MRKWFVCCGWAALLVAAAFDLAPDKVQWFGFGLLVTHWLTGEIAKPRDRPAPPPFEPDWDSAPSKPLFGEPGFEDETELKYEYRLAMYDMRRDAWVLEQAQKMVTSSR